MIWADTYIRLIGKPNAKSVRKTDHSMVRGGGGKGDACENHINGLTLTTLNYFSLNHGVRSVTFNLKSL